MDPHLQFRFLSYFNGFILSGLSTYKPAQSCDVADILHNVLHKFSHDGSR